MGGGRSRAAARGKSRRSRRSSTDPQPRRTSTATRKRRSSPATRARRTAPARRDLSGARQAFAADLLILICVAAAAFILLALWYPQFSKPAGEYVRGSLHTTLGLGMYAVPFVVLLLPAVLLANSTRSAFTKVWIGAISATLLISLAGGLFAQRGWGGLLGDSAAAVGYGYLGLFYPVVLALVALLVLVRLAGRGLVLPLLRGAYGAAVRTGSAVADFSAAVAEDAEVRALQRREAQAIAAAEAEKRERERRERQRQVISAELEAADAPEGESPLIRGSVAAAVQAAPAAVPAAAPVEAPPVQAATEQPVQSAFADVVAPPAPEPAAPETTAPAVPEVPRVTLLHDEFAAAVNAAGAQPQEDPFLSQRAAAATAPAVIEPPPVTPGQLKLFPSTQAGYELPSLALLRDAPQASGEERFLEQRARVIERTLASFNVEAGCINTVVGPRVTRYELRIGPGINVNRIHALADNLALELAVKAVRIEAPVPGLSAVGIEVPNASPQLVTLKSVLESPLNQRANHPLTVALGRDIAGEPVIANLAKMPHVLVAGATGSGKSVCLNALIVSLLYRNAPDTLRLMLIDPKRVEMTCYADLPHLACPVVHDVHQAQSALKWAVAEMDRRYRLLEARRARNIAAFNEMVSVEEQLPFVVIVIDELADLMMLAGQVFEKLVCRIAQLSRAVGIHLVIATQRPDVKVITGTIKANIPSRVAFAVVSQIDSRTILDGGGAERLLGSGDMLFSPIGETLPIRVQGCFLADDEIDHVVEWCRGQANAAYDESITRFEIEEGGAAAGEAGGRDELFDEACGIIQGTGRASTSYLQRRLKIGYNRAARIMEELEQAGVVSPPDAQGNRKVL